jgi:replication factor C large subunit
MAAAYDLDETGVSFITGSGESTNKVESIVADAAERRDEAMEAHSGGAFAGTPGGDKGDSDESNPINTDEGRTDNDEQTDPVVDNNNAGDDDSDAGTDADDDEDQAGLNEFI